MHPIVRRKLYSVRKISLGYQYKKVHRLDSHRLLDLHQSLCGHQLAVK